MPLKACKKIRVPCLFRRRFCHDYQVEITQLPATLPEILPDQPLQTIPRHGPADSLTGDRKTKARMPEIVLTVKDCEVAVHGSLWVSKNAIELR